jgi:hypothetical protein
MICNEEQAQCQRERKPSRIGGPSVHAGPVSCEGTTRRSRR